jgi:hypothetical protein
MFLGGVGGARLRSGRSCGSGSLIDAEPGRCVWLTNAHVVGTRVGAGVMVEAVNRHGRIETVRGRVAAAGYQRGRAVDWAIVESDSLRDFEVSARLLGPMESRRDLITVGSPRCESPSMRRLAFVRESAGVGYAEPVAIGGQSGSGIFQGMRTVGLITWTNGRETLFQTAEQLRLSMRPEWFVDGSIGFPLPDDWVPCCDEPQPCEDGFFGSAEVADRAREELACFSWVDAVRLARPLIDYLFAAGLCSIGIGSSSSE